MTDQEINKIIAEFRGWVMYHPTPESVSKGYPSYSYWTPPRDSKQFAENWGKLEMDYPPDYCNDLNAMHDAENTLNDDQQYEYAYVLDDLIKNRSCEFDLIHASARMRAETFVRTISKWKE